MTLVLMVLIAWVWALGCYAGYLAGRHVECAEWAALMEERDRFNERMRKEQA